MDYKKLGQNIRKYRMIRDLTQEQLSVEVGCCGSHIGQIENGRGVPSLDKIVRIANALQVSTDTLLMDSLDCPEIAYLQDIALRLKKLPFSERVNACEMFSNLMNIIEESVKGRNSR